MSQRESDTFFDAFCVQKFIIAGVLHFLLDKNRVICYPSCIHVRAQGAAPRRGQISIGGHQDEETAYGDVCCPAPAALRSRCAGRSEDHLPDERRARVHGPDPQRLFLRLLRAAEPVPRSVQVHGGRLPRARNGAELRGLRGWLHLHLPPARGAQVVRRHAADREGL